MAELVKNSDLGCDEYCPYCGARLRLCDDADELEPEEITDIECPACGKTFKAHYSYLTCWEVDDPEEEPDE